ncbi:thyroid adenoma associated [Thecamonas trahens ATCC 50062]|uniref:Thyroid adenoma associated n=1 Tax=Thecamonas trahens ATCC 50062 TaxID=461836 RepID=A0A0L0DPC6_THETB|nr:thyroid adenoma associated [Thecamonas trahens ATCC 50062]KNC53278.1 thyroid adenoma associated [Thecamonas trahens ATCC 50062]|eukprot:XP_013754542.1 thyroid adenoma associated [Thecamonas trahens ATCC 50062]
MNRVSTSTQRATPMVPAMTAAVAAAVAVAAAAGDDSTAATEWRAVAREVGGYAQVQTYKESIKWAKKVASLLRKAAAAGDAPDGWPQMLCAALASAQMLATSSTTHVAVWRGMLAVFPSDMVVDAVAAAALPMLADPAPSAEIAPSPGAASWAVSTMMRSLAPLPKWEAEFGELMTRLSGKGSGSLGVVAARGRAALEAALAAGSGGDAVAAADATNDVLAALGLADTLRSAGCEEEEEKDITRLALDVLAASDNCPVHALLVAGKLCLTSVLAEIDVCDAQATVLALLGTFWPSAENETPVSILPAVAPGAALSEKPFSVWPIPARVAMVRVLTTDVAPGVLGAELDDGATKTNLAFGYLLPEVLAALDAAYRESMQATTVAALGGLLAVVSLGREARETLGGLNVAAVRQVVETVFGLWSSVVPGVYGQARETLTTVLEVAAIKATAMPEWACEHESLMDELLAVTSALPWIGRGKPEALSAVVPHVGIDAVLAAEPEAMKRLFALACEANAPCGPSNAFVALAKARGTSEGCEAAWMLPLVEGLATTPAARRDNVIMRIVRPLVNKQPQVLARMLALAQQHDRYAEDWAAAEVVLMLASVGRKLNMFSVAELIELGHFPRELLFDFLTHADSSQIVEALSLVCATSKVTAEPSAFEYEAVLATLPAVVNTPGAKFVADYSAALAIFVKRSLSSLLSATRELASLLAFAGSAEAPPGVGVEQASALVARAQAAISFLCGLLKMVQSCFFPGSSHHRRGLAINIVHALLGQWFTRDKGSRTRAFDLFVASSGKLTDAVANGGSAAAVAVVTNSGLLTALESQPLSPQAVVDLVGGLDDQYDRNREDMASVLEAIEPELFAQRREVYAPLFTKLYADGWRRVLLASHRETSAGALTLGFVLRIGAAALGWNVHANGESSQPAAAVFGFVEASVLVLEEHLTRVEASSWEATLGGAALQGPLCVLSEIIRVLSSGPGRGGGSSASFMAQIGRDDNLRARWIPLLGRVQDAASTLVRLVMPIVATNAPEGTGIDMGAAVADAALETHEVEVATVASQTTQHVMVMVWRAMKAATGLLGQIGAVGAVHSVVPGERVAALGELFQEVLVRVRHRGATEFAMEGLEVMAHALLSNKCIASLRSLPSEWLERALEVVASPATGASVTRRSAGLPFLFLALLRSENGRKRPLLCRAFEGLLDVVEAPLPLHKQSADAAFDDAGVQPQVHAWNTLRALFRESQFGMVAARYLTRALQNVIEGFSSPRWAIRNVCTLTFSALLARSVGANKCRDQTARANAIDAGEFFARHPRLDAYLLEQVESGTTALESGGGIVLDPRLYPALVLLSHLLPPLMERAAASSMAAFRPLLQRCARLPIYSARAMAARALVSTVSTAEAAGVVAQLWSEAATATSGNTLHGLVLQIRSVAEFVASGPSAAEASAAFEAGFAQFGLALAKMSAVAPLVRAEVFRAGEALLDRSSASWCQLVEAGTVELEACVSVATRSVPGWATTMAAVSRVVALGTATSAKAWSTILVGHACYEVQGAALDVLLEAGKHGMLEKASVANALLAAVGRDGAYHEVQAKALEALSRVPASVLGSMPDALAVVTSVAEDSLFTAVRSQSFVALSAVIRARAEAGPSGVESESWATFVQLGLELSSPDAVPEQRLAVLVAIEALGEHGRPLIAGALGKSGGWEIALTLVHDDADEVRPRAASAVSQLVSPGGAPTNPQVAAKRFLAQVAATAAESGGEVLAAWAALARKLIAAPGEAVSDSLGETVFVDESANEFREAWTVAVSTAEAVRASGTSAAVSSGLPGLDAMRGSGALMDAPGRSGGNDR